jgi:DNA polymerase-3 subunit epsilon
LLGRDTVAAESLAATRFVVIDTETTGLDVTRDRLLAIGGVGVSHGRIDPADSFYAVLRQPAPTVGGDILIHRIGTGEQAAGEEPATALAAFREWCAGSWAAGFHADFDRRMLERTLHEQRCGSLPVAGWIDLAVIAPALLPDRGSLVSLDDWLIAFGLEDCDRHNALGDAHATAKLLLPVLARAATRGFAGPQALASESDAALKLRAMRRG